jgi:predicted nicotinamide N-methyase
VPGYKVKIETITIGGADYLIRSLSDLQQYSDPQGEAALVGVSPASWPLFGQIWPSARVLALSMHDFDLHGKRILEIGAGLALASLVIHRRDGDVTVSDWHPLSESFLNENLSLNNLGAMKYQTGNWETANLTLGRFDLIIGSDILYERQQPNQLAKFIDSHAAVCAEIIIVDPDRGNRPVFCREMAGLGYEFTTWRAKRFLENGEAFKGCFIRFNRSAAPVAGIRDD